MKFIKAEDVVLKNGSFQGWIDLGDCPRLHISIVCGLGRYLCWTSDRPDIFWTTDFHEGMDWLYEAQGCEPKQHLVIRMDDGWVLDTPAVFKTERHALDYLAAQAKKTNGHYAVIPVGGFRIVDNLECKEDEE